MKTTLLIPVRNALSAGVCRLFGMDVPPNAFHLPAKNAPASVFLPENAQKALPLAVAADAFPPVLGVPVVERMRLDGGFLLLFFQNAFYDALVSYIRTALPKPENDCGRLALNRMMALSRKGGSGCPADGAAKRLLWQLVCLYERPSGFSEAERAAAAYLTHLPPRERMQLAEESGALADAAARILYYFSNSLGKG